MLRRNKSGQIQRVDKGTAPTDRGPVTGRSDSGRSDLVVKGEDQRDTGTGAREPFTYVHRGTVVIGKVIATGRVRVHGEVRGDVKVDGVLEVAESGSVTGDSVEADVVKVLGRVTADVVASGKVEIWKGGVLTGDVSAPALDIEEGATFNGFSNMLGKGSEGDEPGQADPVGAGGYHTAQATGPSPDDGYAAIGRAGRRAALNSSETESLATADEA